MQKLKKKTDPQICIEFQGGLHNQNNIVKEQQILRTYSSATGMKALWIDIKANGI